MEDKGQSPALATCKKIIDYAKSEPVAFQGVVQAAIAALVGFGLIHWTSEQTGLTLALTAAFLTLLARRHVSPTAKVDGPVAATAALPTAPSEGTAPATGKRG